MKLFYIILLFVIIASALYSQDKTDYQRRVDSLAKLQISKISSKDTLIRDSLKKTINPSGIDSTIKFFAKDRIVFNLNSKTLNLYGESYIEYKTQKLNAETINISFDSTFVTAYGKKDSNGKSIGFPRFKDAGEEYVGEKIGFNLKTRKGVISVGETTMEGGFYYGSKIKRVSDDEYFIQDGCYTTCDAPHPHFYFGSPKMKAIIKDRVLLDPLVVYVEDLPVFMLPFGLFFPSKGGRQSGIIIPSFFFSKNRGSVLEGLGYYFAASDYWDTKLQTDLYSKGGYIIKNETRYALRNVLNGAFNIQYGKTRFNPDDEYNQNWSFSLRHNQTINPSSRFDANAQFVSQDFYRNTSFNLEDRQRQNISSNIGYSKSFNNGSSLSLSFARNQNITTDELSQTFPSFSYSIPQLYPLKGIVADDNWLSQTSFSYSTSGSYNYYKTKIDTNLKSSYSTAIRHNPGISISPKLGFFTLRPNISLSASTYFRKIERTIDKSTNKVIESEKRGVFWEYWYSMGVGASTTLYGIAKPNMMGIKAIRHTFQPSVDYSFSPSFSGSNYDFYGEYYDTLGNKITYSKYEKDGGGGAPRNLSQSLRYSILNSIEAKIKTNDSIGEKNLDLLRFNISGSYNFTADSLKASDISINLRTPALTFISLSANANLTLYDEYVSTINNYKTARKINKYLISEGKGLARLTYFSLQASTSFNSNGISSSTSFGETVEKKDTNKSELGERFSKRLDENEEIYSLFGDDNPGYADLSLPWNLSIDVSYSYSTPTIISIERQLNLTARFGFNLTNTWRVETSANYDFIRKESISPALTITKDLHCWSLYFNWYPTGYNQGFYLKFAIKAPQLQDLKIEKRNSPNYY